jgi:hypothetical protein
MDEKTGRRVENTNTKGFWNNVDQAASKAPEWIKGYVTEITEPIKENTYHANSNNNYDQSGKTNG